MAWDQYKKFSFRRKTDMPEGLWMKCEGCQNLIYKKVVEERLRTCPECNMHFTLSGRERIELLIDSGTFEECWENISPVDALEFVAVSPYTKKIAEAQAETGLRDAAITGVGSLHGTRIMFAVTDSRFIMGSMGSVVGEKLTRSIERATEERIPLIIVSGSGGGARMYEGSLSLMQMAKTSSALARYDDAGGLFISVLTHPTMAGVMASFASLGDIIVAEPGALIGFTGPRVIEQTIRQELPPGFQRSEFLLKHGFLDRIIDRKQMKDELARLLTYCAV